MGLYPCLYYRLFARKYPFNRMRMHADTEVCIEGFPRSANSYAVVAFKLRNQSVKIAHHLHVPAQIISACRKDLPTIVTLRHPLEAVASFLIFQNSRNISTYLKIYHRFYQVLQPFGEQVIWADFKTVVTDFNKIILAVNQKYDKNFNLIDDLEKSQPDIFKKLDEVNQRFFSGETLKGMYPEQQRDELKEKLKTAIQADTAYEPARRIYLAFKEISV